MCVNCCPCEDHTDRQGKRSQNPAILSATTRALAARACWRDLLCYGFDGHDWPQSLFSDFMRNYTIPFTARSVTSGARCIKTAPVRQLSPGAHPGRARRQRPRRPEDRTPAQDTPGTRLPDRRGAVPRGTLAPQGRRPGLWRGNGWVMPRGSCAASGPRLLAVRVKIRGDRLFVWGQGTWGSMVRTRGDAV